MPAQWGEASQVVKSPQLRFAASSDRKLMRRTIKIAKYTPAWAEAFADLSCVLKVALGELALGIEHVGSTSVPGLGAKPIIDLDVIIESPKSLPSLVEALGKVGYHHRGDLGISGRDAFGREDDTVPRDGSGRVWPSHHLYVCAQDSEELRRHLAFRDHLRHDAKTAARYERLKRNLAERYPYDVDSYVEGKSEFISDIISSAAGP